MYTASPRANPHYQLGVQNTARPQRLNFDEYLAEYEQAKKAERNKSPGEHRSKYFNDVFSSSVNLGVNGKNQSPKMQKVIQELEHRSQRAHFNSDRNSSPILQEETSYRAQYVPNIPAEFKKSLDEKDLVKPKGRFKHWEPVMRNLESTYDVKDVPLKSDYYKKQDDSYIDPSRRVQPGGGGKKLFMSKQGGIERSTNYGPGYIAPSYY
jgi:hypothetical protein